MKLKDEDIVKVVTELESVLKNKDRSEYMGCSAIAAMKVLSTACHESNAGSLILTLSDCWFGDKPDEKSHYKIIVKKLKNKPKNLSK